ncbi:DUF4932 domain-containing protein [Flavobacterium gelatinilyticum]|uniref:DUF4932 domain-containing protein n=1 Tax=Flavobacterium gelatinilyticum TaxID=3003260 RepID=UPI0024812325|nr:DUF4932 domain-containing protein [Flavobacterium gelatinilyticum]
MNRDFKLIIILFTAFLPIAVSAQFQENLSKNITLSINENIETYFFAEKLAVEHIGYYVFSNKDSNYDHQPLVSHSFEHFKKWKDSETVLKIADLLTKLRPVLSDNSQILEYLWYCKPFPEKGFRYELPKSAAINDSVHYPGAKVLTAELTNLLISFYKETKAGGYIRQNKKYYKGAMNEASKYIAVKSIPFEEQWYGQKFSGYAFILMPGMPIPHGEDNYRAFGNMLITPKGQEPAMVFSSSVMVDKKEKLSDYKKFGFDNQQVTRLLTVHELGHSFVNPLLKDFKKEIQRDSLLLTPKLKKHLETSYIFSWENCITEHLVRLGEIRTAKLMNDTVEEERLRKEHTVTLGFVLLPFLEEIIVKYESDRKTYPDFKSFLPVIFESLETLKPEDIDKLIQT